MKKFISLFFTLFVWILAGLTLVTFLYIDIFSGIFLIINGILMAIILAFLFRWTFRKMQKMQIIFLARKFFVWIFAFLGFFIVLSVIFVYQNNVIHPAKLANIVLQNDAGQKVIFSEMVHMATSDFFQKKNATFREFQNENFVFITGEKYDSQAKNDTFSQNEFIEIIAKNFHFVEENSSLYEGIDAEKIAYIDAKKEDIDAILWENSAEISDEAMLKFSQEMALLTQKQKNIVRQIIMSFLNFSLKMRDTELEMLAKNPETAERATILKKIINRRSEIISDYILQNSDKNIVAVYEAMYFQGVLQKLQEKDSSWKILSAEALAPYVQ